MSAEGVDPVEQAVEQLDPVEVDPLDPLDQPVEVEPPVDPDQTKPDPRERWRSLPPSKQADAWVAAYFALVAADPDLWPSPDQGRLRGQVAWLDGVVERDLARWSHVPPPAATPKPPLDPAAELCSHCHLAPVKVRRPGKAGDVGPLCGRCHEYRRRHGGQLPPARLNALARRRAG